MNIEQQKERFEKNWKKCAPLFGSKKWEENPDFLYFIDIPISPKLWTEMEKITETLKSINPKANKYWFAPQKMHITLALPARRGKHFQGNEVTFMKKQIEEAVKNISVFEVQLANINCFPDVIFREVFDPTEMLQKLHNDICKRIPFTQKPEYQFENYIPHVSLSMGEGDKRLFADKNFSRNLPLQTMKIERIFLGKASNEEGEYERHILKEFKLPK